MPYELEFTDIFVSQFEKLNKTYRKRIYKKIRELKENPYRHKTLTGPFKNCYRLRVGVYRVIYLPKEKSKKVFLLDVDVRKKVYKKDVSKIIDRISG